MIKFQYTGPSGQKVGFGMVENGQVYEVLPDLAPIVAHDEDFKQLKGRAAEVDALPASPEAPTAPAAGNAAPPVSVLPLDQQIIAYTGAPPTAPKRRRSPKT